MNAAPPVLPRPAPLAWVPDDQIDRDQARAVAEYLTARSALDGTRLWPMHELGDADG